MLVEENLTNGRKYGNMNRSSAQRRKGINMREAPPETVLFPGSNKQKTGK